MARVTRLAQMAYDIIGMEIYNHTDEEYRYAQYGSGMGKICDSLVEERGGKYKQAGAYKQSVDDIKRDAHQHDGNWHTAFALHQHREDERSLEIMEFEEQKREERG